MIIKENTQLTLTRAASNEKRRGRQGFQIHFSERRALLVLIDGVIIWLAVWAALSLWQQPVEPGSHTSLFNSHWHWFLGLLGGWWMLAWLNDLYDVPSSHSRVLSVVRVGAVSVLALIMYLAVLILKLYPLPHVFFSYFALIALPGIVLWRWTYSIVFYRPPFQHRVMIVGRSERGQAITRILKQGRGINCKVMGYVDNEPATSAETIDGMPFLGHESDLPHLVQELQVHEVVVAVERNLEDSLFQELLECQMLGVRVSWMPDVYEKVCYYIPVQHIDPMWALHAMQARPAYNTVQRVYKRFFDLLMVILAWPFFGLALPLIALAIRLDSPGPVFYRQTRAGQGGKPFTILKFRTMRVDAEKDGKARWATEDDDRITRVGRFLRKARLDELPQLLNVLRGEMSLVGPRPERPEFIEQLEREIPFYRTRMMVKPGITGWAQIHYDYGNSMEDGLIKLQYDFYYVRYWSLWLDIYIVFQTFGVVLRLKGL